MIRHLPWIVAHRGDISGGSRENTLAAFNAAIDAGADMIELDVHRLADGMLVVFHDDEIRGTVLANIKYGELYKLAQAVSIEIPRLDQALGVCAGRISLVVELKSGWNQDGVETEVVQAVSQARIRTEEYLLASFDYNVLLRLRTSHPGIRTALLTEDVGFEKAQELLDIAAADLWAPDSATITDEVLASCKDHEIALLPWTVNDDKDMRRFLSAKSVAGIITDRTHHALELRRTIYRTKNGT